METLPESRRESQTEITPSWLDFEVSIVANARSTTTAIIRVGEALDQIRNGKYRAEVETIRATYAQALKEGRDPKKAVDPLKKALPGVLWSGQFSTRNKEVPLTEKLLRHSGLLCADLDNIPSERILEVRTKLATSPHTLAVFISPSGTGLKVLFKIPADAEAHKASFHAVKQHVGDLTCLPIDEACKDVTRLCLVSFDPNTWIKSDEPECTQVLKDTSTQKPKDTTSNTVVALSPCGFMSLCTLDEAIESSLPHQRNTNHRMLFKLAGALLAFQKTTGTIVKDSELRLIHRKWHTRAKPYLNPDQDESEYFTEFLDAWANVVYPLSESELEIAWRRAQTAPTPPEALTAELTSPNLCRLVALCRELQLLNGSEAFYLSPYSVMRLFKQNTHTQACSWISGLCRMGILTLVKPGAPRVRAATYRFNFANLP